MPFHLVSFPYHHPNGIDTHESRYASWNEMLLNAHTKSIALQKSIKCNCKCSSKQQFATSEKKNWKEFERLQVHLENMSHNMNLKIAASRKRCECPLNYTRWLWIQLSHNKNFIPYVWERSLWVNWISQLNDFFRRLRNDTLPQFIRLFLFFPIHTLMHAACINVSRVIKLLLSFCFFHLNEFLLNFFRGM